MAPHYRIENAPGSDFLLVVLRGMFDPASAEAFRRDRDAALLAMTCPPHSHFTLIDVTGCPIQPRGSADLFAAMLAAPPRRSRLLAFVVSSSLAQLQVARLIGGRSEVAIHATRADALDWLCAGGLDRGTVARADLISAS